VFALRAPTMNRVARRIEVALRSLDLGIPESAYSTDFLGTVNKGLRQLGLPILNDLENPSAMMVTAIRLEALV